MGDWPREVKGHTLAKKVDFVRDSDEPRGRGAKTTYLCVKCGTRFDGPEDPKLEQKPCHASTHDWQRSA